ncbi:sulfoquinovosidase [Anaeramoeba flamelloides]|uniref:Sulfoquinovosidase n=1 Tax=Anaeramoeba flamelloides TaxID=1746091 RepID=A0ABQ8XM27_9EUKA|nr:sulfoquinovosidase [Anaeramoeba flamelloides]
MLSSQLIFFLFFFPNLIFGALFVTSDTPLNGTIGKEFNVTYSAKDHSFSISDSLNRKVFWATDYPNNEFLRIGWGDFRVSEQDGNYQIEGRDSLIETDTQTIDIVEWVSKTEKDQGKDQDSKKHKDKKKNKANKKMKGAAESFLRIQGSLWPMKSTSFMYRCHYEATFRVANASLQISVETDSKCLGNRLIFSFGAGDDDVQFMGMGESYTKWLLRSQIVPVLTSEQGVGRGLEPLTSFMDSQTPGSGGGWNTTYSAIPHFVSTDLRSVWLEDNFFSLFDFAKSFPDTIRISTIQNAGHMEPVQLRSTLRLFARDDPVALVETYTNTWSGVMQETPLWAMTGGAIVGWSGGTESVRSLWAQLKSAGVPLAAFWVQDWCGLRKTDFGERLWWNWVLDEGHYPGWRDLVAELEGFGVQMLTYINPYLCSVRPPKATRWLFAEALAKGHLVLNSSGDPYILTSATPDFAFATVDLTSERARKWYSEEVIAKSLIGGGLAAGAMTDFGEYTPFDGTFASGESGFQVHNAFPGLWTQTTLLAIQGCQKSGGQTPLFFHRAMSAKSMGNANMFWMGDQLVTMDQYDGLQSSLTGRLSSGLSGLAKSHTDIGGYTMIDKDGYQYLRSKPILLRWMEFSSIADDIFRTHMGNLPNKSWQINSDNDTLQMFARFVKIHQAISKIRLQIIQDETTTKGLPTTRHTWLNYWKDPNALNITNQFCLGEHIVAAPSFDIEDLTASSSVQVYLPNSFQDSGTTWVHVWSARRYQMGSQIKCTSPIGFPCLFFRSDFLNTQLGSSVFNSLREI